MTRPRMIRVALFDDNLQIHKAVETLLRHTPDIELVGQGATGQEALDLCRQLRPDVVLMDVLMPELNGLEATRRLHAQFPDMKILVLSSLQDHDSVHDLLKNGAVGYITKNALTADLAETLRATAQGKRVFSAEAVAQLLAPAPQPPTTDFNLTAREIEVLAHLAEGANMPEIAGKLKISQSTVKFHLGNICTKLGVRTRSEALIVATKHHLI